MTKIQTQNHFFKQLETLLENYTTTKDVQQFILAEKNTYNLSFKDIFQYVILRDSLDLSIWLFEQCPKNHQNEQYALDTCAERGLTALLTYFVDKGLPYQSWDDATIRVAATYGNIETVKYLQSIGCNLNAHNHAAIKTVALTGNTKLVMDLIDLGASYDIALTYTNPPQKQILQAFKEKSDIQQEINHQQIKTKSQPGHLKL